MNEENKNIYVSYWLLLITSLVGLMIIVGGLTRLTDSGLSITKWDLFVGIIPPLNVNDWQKVFSLYKEIPEFKLQNSSMTLEEFKFIYWWEFAHRFLGRLIGIFYFIPLIYFTYKRFIKNNFLISLYLIFFLILLQGILGWYMVKSGLVDRVDVSHYRLSSHLTLAFIIFVLLLWNYLKYSQTKTSNLHKPLPYNLPKIFLFLLLIQISIGALVSGLDAGQIYTSWPLMNQNYFPDDSNIRDMFSTKVFEIPSIVQFIHRNIAYLIIILFFLIFIIIFRNKDFVYLRKLTLITFIFLFLQIFLGILTVISGAQIILSSMHQIGSIFLISTSLILVFKNTKIN